MPPDMGKFSGQYLIPHSSRSQVSARNCLIAAAALAFVAIGASAQSVDDSIVGEPGPTTIVGPIVGPKVTPALALWVILISAATACDDNVSGEARAVLKVTDGHSSIYQQIAAESVSVQARAGDNHFRDCLEITTIGERRRVGLQSLNAGVHAVVFNRLAASDGSRSRIANFAAMEDDSVPLGNWGGAGISLTVTESAVHIEFDCALATIRESLRLNADGEFEVEGIYVFEPGGPRTQNSPQPKQYPAEFQGWTDRRQMDLTVTVTLLESRRQYGPFSLELGRRAELDKCG